MSTVIAALQERGLIDNISSPELEKICQNPIKLYCGFDPTSDSLHLGNLVGIIVLEWFRRYGHLPYALVGGATGMIGDPGGKTTAREFLSEEILKGNVQGIGKLLNNLLNQSGTKSLPVLNNYDWFSDFNFLQFLRDVGKHFRLGPMLAKDMVRTRLQSEEGMSFTEFSYQLLQGYDFMHLFQKEGVKLQIGGSDQWGNITAGIELTRKVSGDEIFGLTFPLLTKSDGQKFGKSEKGAIWLTEDKLSTYDFYQYLYRVSDDDVVKLLRMLTFIPIQEIRELERKLEEGTCAPNELQKRLAEEVTRFVHREEGLQQAISITEKLAPGKETALSATTFEAIAKEFPTKLLEKSTLLDRKLVDSLAEINVFASKADVKRMIRNGGLYINNNKITDENHALSIADVIEDEYLLIATGKKNKVVVKFTK